MLETNSITYLVILSTMKCYGIVPRITYCYGVSCRRQGRVMTGQATVRFWYGAVKAGRTGAAENCAERKMM